MSIVSFRCRDTEALFNGSCVARFRTIERVAMRKLAMVATSMVVLRQTVL